MNELRLAFRQLLKSPSFTLVAVLALAIGSGANTAIFSVVNAVLLEPLPFPAGERLVALGGADTSESRAGDFRSISLPDFFDLRAQNKSFENVAVHRGVSLALGGAVDAQSLRAQRVSAEFFDTLGVAPQLGRGFRRDEEAAGGGPIGLPVVLSHEFWQRHFKGAPTAVGSALLLDGEPHMVVGVMPPGFQYPIGPEAVDLYTTIASEAVRRGGEVPNAEQRGHHFVQAIGRLKPGIPLAAAQAEAGTIMAALEAQYPETNTNKTLNLRSLREHLVGDVSRPLYILTAAVACVLLIAIANVANLLLARATVRAREMAVRSALGASRGRIIRQLLTESILLSAIGGVLGFLFAAWGIDLLVALVPENIPRLSEIQLDGRVLAFTLAVSALAGILFGLAPAFHASRLDLQNALQEGGRGGLSGGSRNHLRNALVVGEIALALVLLCGAGLLLQTFARLSQVDPGMQTKRLFTAFISLPVSIYPEPEDVWRFQEQLLTGLKTRPGVEEASMILPLPLSNAHMTTSFDIEERPLPDGRQASSHVRIAGPDYFRAAGVPLVRGRAFTERDRDGAPLVMMVNQRFAERHFPGQDVVGKRVAPGMSIRAPIDDPPQREIIGVVGNVKHSSLGGELTPEMYLPALQLPSQHFSLVVRTSSDDAAAVARVVRSELARIDPGIPLTRVRTFEEYVASSLARPRFHALLLGAFAGIALLLTAIGIYGVMAYSVAQRRQEMGIRMALGAQRGDVLRLVLAGGLKLTATGLLIGLSAAFALTRLLSALLFGVEAFDLPTVAAVALLLSGIALLACWFPARRAASLNPMIALRTE